MVFEPMFSSKKLEFYYDELTSQGCLLWTCLFLGW